MRLAAGDDHLAASGQGVVQRRHEPFRADVEVRLGQREPARRPDRLDVGAQARGVLLGSDDGDAERVGRPGQPHGVGDHRSALVDRRHQPGLVGEIEVTR